MQNGREFGRTASRGYSEVGRRAVLVTGDAGPVIRPKAVTASRWQDVKHPPQHPQQAYPHQSSSDEGAHPRPPSLSRELFFPEVAPTHRDTPAEACGDERPERDAPRAEPACWDATSQRKSFR